MINKIVLFLFFAEWVFASEASVRNGFSSYFRQLIYESILKKTKETNRLKKKALEKEKSSLQNKELERREKEKKKVQVVQIEKLKKEMTVAMVEKTIDDFAKEEKTLKEVSVVDFSSSPLPSKVKNLKVSFNLNGVVLFEDEKKAIINGEIYSLGDFVDDETKLVQIEHRYVCLMRGDRLIKIDIPAIHFLREGHFFKSSEEKTEENNGSLYKSL